MVFMAVGPVVLDAIDDDGGGGGGRGGEDG